MDRDREWERISKALQSIKSKLVTAAAAMQAKGVDTSALTTPVAELVEVSAQVELMLHRPPAPGKPPPGTK